MADTIVDPPPEPPPPTIRDPEPPPARAHVAPAKRKSRARVVVAVVVALLGLSVVLGAALVYVLFIRYEPRATKHIPSNASFAMRMDAADVALFAPVRKHLLEQLEAAPAGGGKSRVDRIESATGIDVRTDLREIVVASVDGSKILVLAGGHIPRGRFVAGVEKLLAEDGVSGWHREGALLLGPTGQAIAQADDGTIAFATHRALVEAALPASSTDALGLPEDAAVSFAVTSAAWKGLSGIASVLGDGDLLAHITRATGTLALGDTPKLALTAEPTAGVTPAALEADLDRVLGELRLVMILSPDRYGEKGALTGVKVHAEGSHVLVEADWPYAGLERACDDAAKLF